VVYRTGDFGDFIADVLDKATLPGVIASAIKKNKAEKAEEEKKEKEKQEAAVKSVADFATEASAKTDKKKEKEKAKEKAKAAAVPWWVWVGLLYIVGKS
jgi:hypothetical protein